MKDLLAPAFLAYVLSFGCATAQDAIDRVVQAPAIEVQTHGEATTKLRALASRGHGTLDLQAVSVGCFLFYFETPALEVRKHEYTHCRQWRREGPLYLLNYWTENALHQYAGNRYEIEARAAETDPNAPTADSEK